MTYGRTIQIYFADGEPTEISTGDLRQSRHQQQPPADPGDAHLPLEVSQ